MSLFKTPVKKRDNETEQPDCGNAEERDSQGNIKPVQENKSHKIELQEEGYSTPVVSKRKGVLVAARREIIGTMSSFFKKTVNKQYDPS